MFDRRIPKSGTLWSEVLGRSPVALPAAWDGPNKSLLNLADGNWSGAGRRMLLLSPIKGVPPGSSPVIHLKTGKETVECAFAEVGGGVGQVSKNENGVSPIAEFTVMQIAERICAI